MTDFIVSFGIPLAYLALAIATIAAIAFPIIYMVQDFKKALGAFAGVGVLVLIFIVCYMLTSDGDFTIGEIHVTEGSMKFVEAGIYAFYVTFVGSILAIVYATISRYFK